MVLDFKLLQNRTKRALEIDEETFNTIVKNNKLNYYQTCKSHGANRNDMSVWVDVSYIDIEKLEARIVIQRGVTYDNNILYRVISQYPGTVPIINPNGIIDITPQILDDSPNTESNENIKDSAETSKTNNVEITKDEIPKLGGKHKKKSKKNKLNKIKLIFKSKKKMK
jgi:hypothetical protein